MYKREEYLKKIRPYYHDNRIKVIMGVRRCGKSTLINQIIDEIINDNVDINNIHLINFDLFDNHKYTNTSILNKYLSSLFRDNNKHYLFLDEVQNINDWEKIVNIFNYGYNLSIFVSGSNSNLINEKNKRVLDNYISFNILPFSFRELVSIKDSNIDNLFENYIKWGSMPLLINEIDDNVKKTYISDVFNSIVIKDIVQRYNVKDIDLLNKIISYILMTLSEPFKVNSMAEYFETYDRKVSLDTMYNYLEYINSSFMINKLERYNISENRVIYGKYKYYLSDINFSNALNSYPLKSKKYRLENIVYNELISKGYKVYQGIVGIKLIDMIAIKGDRRIYIEVHDKLDLDTIKKVFKKFIKIKDGEKIVLSLDNNNYSNDSIKHINIIDFLINNNL